MIIIYIFNDLIKSKVDKIKLSVIPRLNEEYMSVKYGFVNFLDSMGFQQDSLKKLTESLNDQNYIHLKRSFQNTGCYLRRG